MLRNFSENQEVKIIKSYLYFLPMGETIFDLAQLVIP